MMLDFSTTKITPTLLREISNALKSVKSYGSVEIFVHKKVVTQITVRSIKKTADNTSKVE